MSGAYYNEIDRYAAQWLRNLIAAGHIAAGDVDERSITEVQPDDLRGYTQCHFFAGIGGWSYALRLAGWPDDRPVWTGSCPCQPFSAAGKQRGSDDERHLWPAFFDLIRKCRPGTVFGEQVAGAAGAAWWDHVAADLEGAGYAAAAANLGAHSVGAPHIRQRLYWVADRDQSGRGQHGFAVLLDGERAAQRNDADRRGADGVLGDACDTGFQIERRFNGVSRGAGGTGAREAAERADAQACRMVDATSAGRETERQAGEFQGRDEREHRPWDRIEWIECSDGKARPTQPGLFPLAHGIPNRVGRLRAYGNAIVPQVAAAFVRACA